MTQLESYRNRIDDLAEARADRDAASLAIALVYAALCQGDSLLAYNHITAARQHLDALELRTKTPRKHQSGTNEEPKP